jgi:hypothetical protein
MHVPADSTENIPPYSLHFLTLYFNCDLKLWFLRGFLKSTESVKSPENKSNDKTVPDNTIYYWAYC